MWHTSTREKHSQLGAGDVGRQDMSYRAVLVGWRSQEGQKCSMRGEWKGRSVVNVVGATTGMTGVPL